MTRKCVFFIVYKNLIQVFLTKLMYFVNLCILVYGGDQVRNLADYELPYCLAILDSIDNSSVLDEELKKYPKDIVEWLEENALLVSANIEVENRVIERRTALGMRAINLPRGFIDKINILKSINNG